jgi:hypothetical protein
MVAQYFGLETSFDGAAITPFEMNRWLQENDGYVGLNNVNWAKVEKYLGTSIDGVPHKRLALDYEHFKTRSSAVVDATLGALTPVIAFSATAGHYFVLDGKVADTASDTYTVRDPRWYNTQTLDDVQDLPNEVRGYGNAFTHGTIFRKLASPVRIAVHVELYLASPAELLVTDALGRRSGRDPRSGVEYDEIPGALYYEEDRVVSSDSDIDEGLLHRAKVLMLPELSDGTYRVDVIGTGMGPYTLTAVMTDSFGSTTQRIYPETTAENDVSSYLLGIKEGVAVSLQPTWDEVLRRIRALIGASGGEGVQAAFAAQVDGIERQIAAERFSVAQRLVAVLRREADAREKSGQMSPETAAELRELLDMLRDVI